MPDRGATDRQRLGIARATRKENVRVEGSGRSRTQEARTGLPEPKRARQSGWCGVNRMAHRRDERRLAARDAGARLENRISVGCRRRPSVSLGRVSPPAFPGRKTRSQPGEVIRTSLCGSLRTIDVGSRVEALAKGARERSAPHQCWVALRAHSLHSGSGTTSGISRREPLHPKPVGTGLDSSFDGQSPCQPPG
jgi:hypothetical protein